MISIKLCFLSFKVLLQSWDSCKKIMVSSYYGWLKFKTIMYFLTLNNFLSKPKFNFRPGFQIFSCMGFKLSKRKFFNIGCGIYQSRDRLISDRS